MASPQLEILRLEHATWVALKRSATDLLPFLSPDCSMIFPGAPDIFSASSSPSLNEILARDDFKPWTSYAISNERVVDLGNQSKAVLYHVRATRDGSEYEALITSVWRRRGLAEEGLAEQRPTVPAGDGKQALEWEMVVHQQTPVSSTVV